MRLAHSKPEMVRIFGVLTPIPPRRAKDAVRFRAPKDGGIIWEYVEYPSLRQAALATGKTISAMRYRLERI